MNQLGDLVRDKRKECRLSIQELANAINVSRMTIVRLEENKTKLISFRMIISLSNVLDLDLDLLEIIKAYGNKLIRMDIKNVLTTCKIITYKGQKLDKIKFEELIKDNITNVQ